MKFYFNVTINDQDYLDYNKFWMLRSHYGKKQMLSLRISVALICFLGYLASLYVNGFSVASLCGSLSIAIFLQLIFSSLYIFILKRHIKQLKKTGKMGYSPSSIMEFYEDSFIEETPVNKTEQKYSVVERISIVEGTVIYIHVNNIMSYILPSSCFASKEQYDNFIDFLKTRCINIDTY